MTEPVLLAVAHGGRQAVTQRSVHSLARQVRRAAPAIDTRVAFVQHGQPSLPEALAEAGPHVVVVPLLLGAGYHLSVDIGEAAAACGARVAAALGPDPDLTDALLRRLADTGVPGGSPVVLAAAGSRDPRAAEQARRQAALLASRWTAPVLTGYLSACRPSVREAVAALRKQTLRPVAVATYLLSPGFFHDQLRLSGAAWVSAPLGDHPSVARLVLERFRVA